MEPRSKLRMKDTPVDIEAVLKEERRQRRKRRRAERATDDHQGQHRSRPAPPRSASPDRGHGYDESALPPGAERQREDDFDDKLHAAMEEDQGVGFYEDMYETRMPARWRNEAATSFSYGAAAGIAMGLSHSGLDGMEEEEYAEYVRAGMWRRNHREEALRLEELEKQRLKKLEQDRITADKRRAAEREKIQRLEDKVKRRGKREEQDTRERYDLAWKRLLAIPVPLPRPPETTGEESIGPAPAPPLSHPLSFTDFAWPLYPPIPFPPLSWPTANDITPQAIKTFLLAHLDPATPAAAKKAILRSAVLAYHPDRFDRLLSRIPEENVEVLQRVRELGLRVSQVLNDLIKS